MDGFDGLLCGCGKTILLQERAEYLLREYPTNTVHFHIHIDNEETGLFEVLKTKFANKNIKIKTNQRMFYEDFDFSSDGVNQNDHVIIDEAYMWNSQRFLAHLKKLKTQVSTLWMALGSVDSLANSMSLTLEWNLITSNSLVQL